MRVSILLLLCIISLSATAQRVNISNPKTQYFYKDLTNNINVLVEDCNCDEIELVGENLSINEAPNSQNELSIGNCKYYVSGKAYGKASITVFDIRQGKRKELANWQYVVKSIPQPRPLVANKQFGKIAKNILILQQGVFAKLIGFTEGCITYKVSEYTVIADIKSSNKVIRRTYTGQKITEDLREIIRRMNSGDEIYFVDIKYNTPDEKDMELLSSVRLTIEE